MHLHIFLHATEQTRRIQTDNRLQVVVDHCIFCKNRLQLEMLFLYAHSEFFLLCFNYFFKYLGCKI